MKYPDPDMIGVLGFTIRDVTKAHVNSACSITALTGGYWQKRLLTAASAAANQGFAAHHMINVCLLLTVGQQ